MPFTVKDIPVSKKIKLYLRNNIDLNFLQISKLPSVDGGPLPVSTILCEEPGPKSVRLFDPIVQI